MTDQDLIEDNSYFKHILKHQKKYLLSLLLAIAAAKIISNYSSGKPLLIGGESYYYLAASQQGLVFNPLAALLSITPSSAHFLLPPLAAAMTLLLFLHAAKKLEISEKITFFAGLFAVMSPISILSLVSFLGPLFFLLLLLAGFSLLLRQDRSRYLSLLPFTTAAFFDLFSTAVLLLLLSLYFFMNKMIREKFSLLTLTALVSLLTLNGVYFRQPAVLGPFHIQQVVPDLISDLGGWGGVGFFTMMLAIIGLFLSWKKKWFFIALPLTGLFAASFILNTQSILFLSCGIIGFAAIGLVGLFEQRWVLPFMKKTSFLLLLLGILFSAAVYAGRISDYPPSETAIDTLSWIKDNTLPETIVLSAPENGYYLQYFAQRKPVFSLHDNYRRQINLSAAIFSSTYIEELFPILEENNVSIIYVDEEMKKSLPQDQGFRFLLNNERFKLVYSSKNQEVWSFR